MLPIYKMILTDEEDGMDAIALVSEPAHSKAFEFFNGKSERVKYHFNEDKRIVTGVAIAVDLPIYRNDSKLGEHYVIFSKEETLQIAQKMFKSNYMHNVNEMHDSNKNVKDIYLFESYFIDEERGVKAPDSLKGQNLKNGSWIVSYKVDDLKVWEEIKKGKHIGFSIEGFFDKKFIKTTTTTKKTQMKKANKSLFEMVFGREKFETATTVEGVQVSFTELVEGAELKVITEEGEVLAPEGVHTIEQDSKIMAITVDGNGIIVSIEEMPVEEEAPADAVTPEEVATVIEEVTTQMNKQIKALQEKNEVFAKQIETLVSELDKNDKKKFNTVSNSSKTWRQFTK